MTPEEQAVLDAAIVANPIGRLPSTAEQTLLRQAVHKLISSRTEWVKTTWKYVLAGDRVRLGQQEAEIERGGANDFHCLEGPWEEDPVTGKKSRKVTRWDHSECSFLLKGRTVPMPFIETEPVEVLMNEERRNQLVMMEAGFAFTHGECTQRYCKICGPTLHDAQTKNEELGRPVTMQDIKADRVGPRAEYLAHQRKAANYRRATRL